jgi:nitroreductase
MQKNEGKKVFAEKLLNLVKERRSLRIFTGEKISKEIIIRIIEAGVWAPTGCNNQELKFLIINNEKNIKDILAFKPFFKGVSSVVLVFCDMSLPMSYKMYVKYKHERHLPYVDTGLALSNMVLYAKSNGIDSCIFNLSEYHFKWDTNYKKTIIVKMIDKYKRAFGFHKSMKNNFENYIRNKLEVPKHLKIMCGVAFGYAERYPDVQKDIHGGRKIMRSPVENYIIKQR